MIQGNKYKVHIGNNLDVLPTLPDCSVDSIVTDPPYELGFMGKKWDNTGIAYNSDLWRECLRVLKPGGHLLSFGGSRTWHRIAVAIEGAGFEVRDSIAWLYGSGFPKSLDISKAIDKAAGAVREVVGKSTRHGGGSTPLSNQGGSGYADNGKPDITAPSTPEAKQWEGWGTALKPAFEPVIVARKPLIGTVAENVLTYGTGGLNIDGSRIKRKEGDNSAAGNRTATFGTQETKSGGDGSGGWEQNDFGRWPANVILDPYTAELLDEQSGVSVSKSGGKSGTSFASGVIGSPREDARQGHNDSGGASRFFYVAKASKRDRNEGLEELEDYEAAHAKLGINSDAGLEARGRNPENQPRTAKNFHPTVKPTDLMRYLIKLVTPPNGIVLDPFTGSGSTGKAAILEGFRFIGIEMTEDYIPIIAGRLKHAEAERNKGLF